MATSLNEFNKILFFLSYTSFDSIISNTSPCHSNPRTSSFLFPLVCFSIISTSYNHISTLFNQHSIFVANFLACSPNIPGNHHTLRYRPSQSLLKEQMVMIRFTLTKSVFHSGYALVWYLSCCQTLFEGLQSFEQTLFSFNRQDEQVSLLRSLGIELISTSSFNEIHIRTQHKSTLTSGDYLKIGSVLVLYRFYEIECLRSGLLQPIPPHTPRTSMYLPPDSRSSSETLAVRTLSTSHFIPSHIILVLYSPRKLAQTCHQLHQYLQSIQTSLSRWTHNKKTYIPDHVIAENGRRYVVEV